MCRSDKLMLLLGISGSLRSVLLLFCFKKIRPDVVITAIPVPAADWNTLASTILITLASPPMLYDSFSLPNISKTKTLAFSRTQIRSSVSDHPMLISLPWFHWKKLALNCLFWILFTLAYQYMAHFIATGVKDSYHRPGCALYWYQFSSISYGCNWAAIGCSCNLHVLQVNIDWPLRCRQLHFSVGVKMQDTYKFFSHILQDFPDVVCW